MYSSMIAAGQVALLPEELSSQIVNLYEHVYTRLAANGEHYDYVLEREFTPSYARGGDPARRDMICGRSVRTHSVSQHCAGDARMEQLLQFSGF